MFVPAGFISARSTFTSYDRTQSLWVFVPAGFVNARSTFSFFSTGTEGASGANKLKTAPQAEPSEMGGIAHKEQTVRVLA